MAVQGGIDCDVHPASRAPARAAALSRRLLARAWSRCAASTGSTISSYPPLRPLERAARLARPGGQRAPISTAARGAARPLRPAARDPATASTASQLLAQRGHGAPPSPARSTTGSPPSGSTPSRGCAPRSWCRRRTPSSRSRRSSACAADRRFVQVLLLAMGDTAARQALHWPIYRRGRASRAADRHPRRQHLPPRRSAARLAVLLVEDYVDQPQAFQASCSASSAEGVFAQFPRLGSC